MSELHRAIEAEINAHRPNGTPPLAALRARKRRRDQRRAAAVAVSTLAVAGVAVTATSWGLPAGHGTGTTVVGAPTGGPRLGTGPDTAAPSPSASEAANIRASAPSTPSPAAAASPCRTDQLQVTLGPGGGAAGTFFQRILFQNRAQTPCTLTGYPRVSFLDRARHQVGATATQGAGWPIGPVTLTPQGFANAAVGVTDPANYQTSTSPSSSTCRPALTAYVRIYPPGQRSALAIPYKTQVCTAKTTPVVTPTGAGRGNG